MSVDNVPIEIKGNYIFNGNSTPKSWSYVLDNITVGNIVSVVGNNLPITTSNIAAAGNVSLTSIRKHLLEKSLSHLGGMHNLLINTTPGEIIDTTHIEEKLLDNNLTNTQPLPQTLGGKKKSSHKSKSTQKRKQKKNNKTRFAQRKR